MKCFRNSGTYLVAQLALSDFLVCLFGMLILNCSSLFYIGELAVMIPAGVSIATVISISIVRFLMVCTYPLKHRFFMEKKIMLLWLVDIWLLSSIYPTKFVIMGRTKDDEISQRILALTVTIFTATMYTVTFFKLFNLKKQSQNVKLCNATSGESRAQQKRLSKELKQFLRTIILIASITLVCISPRIVLKTVDGSGYVWQKLDRKTITILKTLLHAVYIINFAVNPCIYFVRLPNYRKTFKLLFCGNSR